MIITGTHIHYYFYCKKKLWLFIHDLKMEHTSQLIELGNIIEKSTYNRRSNKNKQVLIGSIKVDYVDKKKKIIHEIKKSSKNLNVSIWQTKYYLYILGKDWKGIIEIPNERKKEHVIIDDNDINMFNLITNNINSMEKSECPQCENIYNRKNCSYYNLCYS